MPITPAQAQIHQAINTDILKPSNKDSRKISKEKKVVKSALLAADTEIELQQTALERAEKKAASNAIWAKRGKIAVTILAGGIIVLCGRFLFWILKLFRVIP